MYQVEPVARLDCEAFILIMLKDGLVLVIILDCLIIMNWLVL